ncbi:MAG: hypothetical protein QM710_05280 [Flavobacterium sp.]
MKIVLHFVLFDNPKLSRKFKLIDKKHKKIDEMHVFSNLTCKKLTSMIILILVRQKNDACKSVDYEKRKMGVWKIKKAWIKPDLF